MRTDKMAETLTPIVTRVANDEELRAHAMTALDSAKVIYAKMQADGPRKAATSRAVTDEVMKAAAELRIAAARLSDKPAKKSRKFGRLLIGGAIAVAAAIGIKKVLASNEDEFDYEP
jgi:hypothetical protein